MCWGILVGPCVGTWVGAVYPKEAFHYAAIAHRAYFLPPLV
jgi:hypothetical protein